MQKIDILGISITDYSLKESLLLVDKYIRNGALNTLLYVTPPMLILAGKEDSERERMEAMDMLLCGDADILRVAGIDAKSRQYEVENLIFMKEFLRRIENSGTIIYLIGESEEDIASLRTELGLFQKGIAIAGSSVMEEGNEDIGKVVNSINDVAPSVIISRTIAGRQEKWMSEAKPILNAEVWLGIPKDMKLFVAKEPLRKKALDKIYKSIFRRRMNRYNEKNDKNE